MLQVRSHTAHHYQGAALTQSIHTLTHVQSAIVSNHNTHIGASNGSTNNKPTYTHPTLADGCAHLHFSCSFLQTCRHLMSNQTAHLGSVIKPPDWDELVALQTVILAWFALLGRVKSHLLIITGEIMSHGGRKGTGEEERTAAGGWKEVWLRIVKSFCSYLLKTLLQKCLEKIREVNRTVVRSIRWSESFHLLWLNTRTVQK